MKGEAAESKVDNISLSRKDYLLAGSYGGEGVLALGRETSDMTKQG